MEMAGQWKGTENTLHHEGHEEHEGLLMEDSAILRYLRALRGESKHFNLNECNWRQQLPFDGPRGFGAL
jgi:hypothetical protein